MTSTRGRIAVAAMVATALATPSLEAAWMLWVESPEGSDLWTKVTMGLPQFESAEECARRAQELNALEAAFAKMQGARIHDLFTCLPDTVDPRPEGALLLDPAKRKGNGELPDRSPPPTR